MMGLGFSLAVPARAELDAARPELPPFDLFAICADLSTDEATTIMVQKSKCQVRHVNRVGVAGFC